MKNLFSIALIALVFVATSCSKEAKLNRKIAGEWNSVKIDGEATLGGTTHTFKFEKDKKGSGNLLYTISNPYVSQVYQGTYTLTEDNLITMTYLYDGKNTTFVYVVHDYSKKSLIMTSGFGTIFELEKK